MNCLQSLKTRTTEDTCMEENTFKKALCVFSPFVVYYVLNTIILFLMALLIKYLADKSVAFAHFCENKSTLLSVIIQIISKGGAFLAVLPAFITEKPAIIYKDAPKKRYVLAAIAGISFALLLNIIFTVTGLISSSVDYAEVADRQFSLPILTGVLFYGIFTPVIEEVLFRGIIYNRLRRNYTLSIALLVSAGLFGVYHGNIVQAIYGLFMGLILALIYEKYGGFIYPVIVHGAANSFIYLCMSVEPLKKSVLTLPFACLCLALAVLSLFMILSEKKREEE